MYNVSPDQKGVVVYNHYMCNGVWYAVEQSYIHSTTREMASVVAYHREHVQKPAYISTIGPSCDNPKSDAVVLPPIK